EARRAMGMENLRAGRRARFAERIARREPANCEQAITMAAKQHSRKEGAYQRPAGVRPFWSGTITFGLVSVPVNLFPAQRHNKVGLRMLAPDGTPLARRFYCPLEGVEVHAEHIVRGYEVADDE